MTFEIENVYPEVVLPDYETVIKNVIEAALDYEKCPYEVQVYVLLTDNEEIHQINRAVSYTHLDVYKRQIYNRSSWCCRNCICT